jgi:hypothetical protein
MKRLGVEEDRRCAILTGRLRPGEQGKSGRSGLRSPVTPLPGDAWNCYRAGGSEVIAVHFRLPRINKKLTSWE